MSQPISGNTDQLRPHPHLPTYLISVSRAAAMSEERLWKFRKPEWLNSVYARNAGVYSAGALVSCPSIAPHEGIGG